MLANYSPIFHPALSGWVSSFTLHPDEPRLCSSPFLPLDISNWIASLLCFLLRQHVSLELQLLLFKFVIIKQSPSSKPILFRVMEARRLSYTCICPWKLLPASPWEIYSQQRKFPIKTGSPLNVWNEVKYFRLVVAELLCKSDSTSLTSVMWSLSQISC